MKVKIDLEEWWPVYEICRDDKYGKECEVPDHLVERYKKAFSEFEKVQQEMEAIYKAE